MGYFTFSRAGEGRDTHHPWDEDDDRHTKPEYWHGRANYWMQTAGGKIRGLSLLHGKQFHRRLAEASDHVQWAVLCRRKAREIEARLDSDSRLAAAPLA